MTPTFSHEKLHAYTESIRFVSWARDLLECTPKHLAVWDQLDRAADSVPLNLAQGNGRFSPADRCRFFDIARGSALECAACIDILCVQGRLAHPDSLIGKKLLHAVVSMLVGLSRSSSPHRLCEPETDYRAHGDATASLHEQPTFFDHERLSVYQESIAFVGWTTRFIDQLPQRSSLSTKLDRASTAIPLAIAEGNGKITAPDRRRFFENGRSAAFHCAACLDTFVAKQANVSVVVVEGKTALHSIVSMLVGLLRLNPSESLAEESLDYQATSKGLEV